jgi:hypothetical protein
MKQGMNNVTVMPVQISNQDEHCSRTDAECHQIFFTGGDGFPRERNLPAQSHRTNMVKTFFAAQKETDERGVAAG